MTSRVLGLVREQVLAAIFGASDAMDAFLVAFRVPNLLRDLFAEGAMSAAFVPTFTRELKTRGRDAAWHLGYQVLTALIIITSVLVVVGIIFAEPIVRALASSYADVPGKIQLTVQLTRLMLPFLILVAMAAAFMGMLNALHRFFLPALSPAMFNVASILSAVLLVPIMPRFGLPGISAIAIGALLGGALQLIVQWPLLRKEGFRYRPAIDWHDAGLRRVLLLMGPGTVGLAATQVNLFVNTVLATGEGTGAVSWLNYAFRLMYMPIALFGVSIATATLPSVSRHAADNDWPAIRRTVADGLSLMLALTVPATVGLIVLAVPIIRIIFERRAFLPADTLATAAALQYYAIGLVGYSIVRITSPTFYALGRSLTPVKVSAATMLVNVVLNLLLVRIMGHRGLALGLALAALFNGITLIILLRGQLAGLEIPRLKKALVRMLVASASMGGAAYLMDRLMVSWIPGSDLMTQTIRLGGTIFVALLVLAVLGHVLDVKEFRASIELVMRRLRRTTG